MAESALAAGISNALGNQENNPINITASLSTQDINNLIDLSCHHGPLGLIKSLFADPRIDLSANKRAAIKTAADNGQCNVVQLLLDDENVNPGDDANFKFEMSCRAGDVETVQQLLKDPLMDPSHCVEALAQSCRLGRTKCVKVLLEDGRIDPAATFDLSDLAASNGHCDILDLLVADGRIEESALVCFAGAGDVSRVQSLLDGASSATDDTLLTALVWASEFGRAAVVSLLLSDPQLGKVTISEKYNASLKNASRNGHVEVVKMLLADQRIGPSVIAGDIFLYQTATNGHCEVLELLMQDQRINIGLNPTFAFQYHCGAGNTQLVRESLKQNVDPSTDENSAVKQASRNGRVSIVKLLLADSRVNPSANNSRAMELACRAGQDAVVKLLLADPRVDPSRNSNYTIRWASRNGHVEVVKLLLADSRVNPSANDNNAVKNASFGGHDLVVKLLLKDSRVDPSATNNQSIKWASEFGHASVVKLLMTDPRVDPSATRNSALQAASSNGFASVIKLLFTDERVVALDGEALALVTACEYGRVGVVRLILARPLVLATREHLLVAESGGHKLVIKQLIAEQPKVMLTLFRYPTICGLGGPLWTELQWWEARSAKTMLLCVKRIQSDVVAARVGDVLRDVVEEFTCFDVYELSLRSE